MPSPAPTSTSAMASQTRERSGSSATPARPPATRIAPAAAAVRSSAPRASGPTASVVAGSTETSSAAEAGDRPQTSMTRITTRKSAPTSEPEISAREMFARRFPRTRAADAAVMGRAARQPASSASSATGAWKAKIARQSSASVRRPPMAGPSAAPTAAATLQRRTPSVGSALASRNAPPSACTTRRAMSTSSDPASAQPADPAANRISPPCRQTLAPVRRTSSTTSGVATHHRDVVDRDHEGDALDRGVELAQEVRQREHDDRRVGERQRDRGPDGGLADRQGEQSAHGWQPATNLGTVAGPRRRGSARGRPIPSLIRHSAGAYGRWHGTRTGNRRVRRAAGDARGARRAARGRAGRRRAVDPLVAPPAIAEARAHGGRARAAEPGARRPDRLGRAVDRARARRVRRRPRSARLGRVPLPGLRGLRQGALRPVRARRQDARANRAAVLDVLPALADRPPAAARAAGLPPRRLGGPRGRVRGRRPPARRARERAPRLERGRPLVGRAPRQLGSLRRRRCTAPRAATPSGCAAAISTSRATAGTAIWPCCPPAACDLRAADRAGRGARPFDPGAVAPWDKQAWADPGVEHTGAPGSSPGEAAAAARAWAAAVGVARPGSGSRSSGRSRDDRPRR